MERVKALVYKDNNEFIREVPSDAKVVTSKQSEHVKNKYAAKQRYIEEQEKGHTLLTWKYDDFVKVNTSEYRELVNCLTMSELGFFSAISTYVNYRHGCLVHSNGKNVTAENMEKMTGQSRTTVARMIKSLMSKNVMAVLNSADGTQYYINPFIYAKGDNINATLSKMFGGYSIKSKKSDKLKKKLNSFRENL